MTRRLPTARVVCGEFQKLFQESTVAKEALRKLRAEICWAQLVSKETVDELLRLQAKYACVWRIIDSGRFQAFCNSWQSFGSPVLQRSFRRG